TGTGRDRSARAGAWFCETSSDSLCKRPQTEPRSPRSLEIPVHVEEEVGAAGAAGRHVAPNGKLAVAQRDDGVVGSNDAGAEADRARDRRRLAGRINPEVAVVGRLEDGEIDRDGRRC